MALNHRYEIFFLKYMKLIVPVLQKGLTQSHWQKKKATPNTIISFKTFEKSMFLKDLVNEIFTIQYDWWEPCKFAHFKDVQWKLV